MNSREKQELDRHITGNYGEDQFPEDAGEMTPEQEAEEAAMEHGQYVSFMEDKLDQLDDQLKRAREALKGDMDPFVDHLSRAEEMLQGIINYVTGDDI